VSFTWQGRSRTQFVRREHVATVRQQLRTYERLRELVEAWIAAGLELFALAVGGSALTPSSTPSVGPSRQILTKSRRERAARNASMCRNWLSDRTFSGFDTETN
jgi:hypothetical protein